MPSLSVKTLTALDAQQLLNRLLRRQNLEVLGNVLRIACIVIIFAGVLALALSLVESSTRRYRLESDLEGRIASVVADVNRPASQVKNDKDVMTIAQREIFGTLGRVVAPPPVATAPPTTPLSLTLIGTFVTGGENPYAIIEDKKKQTQDVFIINQSIFGQANLKKIFEDRVEIEREGKIEILKLDDLGGGADSGDGVSKTGQDEFVVDEGELDKGLENLPLLLTQARAVPYFKEGRSIGLRLFAIKSGSLYEKIGLKNGDIIKSINGNSLGDISQALKLFEQLKQERSISLTLEREKQDREFRYQIR
jgi:type II secretion system protein C